MTQRASRHIDRQAGKPGHVFEKLKLLHELEGVGALQDEGGGFEDHHEYEKAHLQLEAAAPWFMGVLPSTSILPEVTRFLTSAPTLHVVERFNLLTLLELLELMDSVLQPRPLGCPSKVDVELTENFRIASQSQI